MNRNSIEKTAFCPRSLVVYSDAVWTYQTCQCGLDDVLRDCKFCVNNYVLYGVTRMRSAADKIKAAGFT